jgi:hypothetical protein
MKKIFIYIVLLFAAYEIHAQTLIATSSSSEATANHNQRKIVRDSFDNVYVVFADSIDGTKVIKGLWFDKNRNSWSDAKTIAEGTNPTISITKNGEFHLVYEDNSPQTEIWHTSSSDFSSWTNSIKLSEDGFENRLPVCDSDFSGKINVFWLKYLECSDQSLVYACLDEDTLSHRKTVITKENINDIAIANHLQNFNDHLLFSMQFSEDSILFFMSTDNMESMDTIYRSKGSQPCISFNSLSPWSYFDDDNSVRLLYIDESKQLVEVEYFAEYNLTNDYIISPDPTDYVCIDDIAPPLGYSFLFMQNGNLYHGFSYGTIFWPANYIIILDTISSNPVNPSIAYKNFNPLFVDYIWTESNDNGFDIFYKRDEKHEYIGAIDDNFDKGFTLTGYPNPFNSQLNISVTVHNGSNIPVIEIYDLNSRRVAVLKQLDSIGNEYIFTWDAKSKNLPTGLYLIKCIVGYRAIAKKVIFMN